MALCRWLHGSDGLRLWCPSGLQPLERDHLQTPGDAYQRRGLEARCRLRRAVRGFGSGRIRSLPRLVKRGSGFWRRPSVLIKLKPESKLGYVAVTLTSKRTSKRFRVHTLVLTAFVGSPEGEHQCRHLNGVRTDNRLCNLAWGTPKENAADRGVHGTQAKGTQHGKCKLSEHEVAEIRERYQKRSSRHGNGGQLAREYGISISQVHNIVRGKRWRDAQ